MVLGYLAIGTLLGAAAAVWGCVAWQLAVWWAALIYVAVGNVGTLAAAALHLVMSAQAGPCRRGPQPVADPAEAVGDSA